MPVAVLARPDDEVAEVLITFDDFVRMDDEGFFGDEKHLELIGGRIYSLAPISLIHASTQSNVMFTLRSRLADYLRLSSLHLVGSASLHIDDLHAPEFDAAVVAQTAQRFLTPSDARLIIEVAVTSTTRDLKAKVLLYAGAEVPEYWVVNKRLDQLHVFRQPQDGGYCERLGPFRAGDAVTPLFAPDVAIPVADLL